MADSKKIQITLSSTVMKKLDEICAEKGVKRSAIVSIAVTEYVERQKGAVHGSK